MIPARPGRVVLIVVCYFLDVMVYLNLGMRNEDAENT